MEDSRGEVGIGEVVGFFILQLTLSVVGGAGSGIRIRLVWDPW